MKHRWSSHCTLSRNIHLIAQPLFREKKCTKMTNFQAQGRNGRKEEWVKTVENLKTRYLKAECRSPAAQTQIALQASLKCSVLPWCAKGRILPSQLPSVLHINGNPQTYFQGSKASVLMFLRFKCASIPFSSKQLGCLHYRRSKFKSSCSAHGSCESAWLLPVGLAGNV